MKRRVLVGLLAASLAANSLAGMAVCAEEANAAGKTLEELDALSPSAEDNSVTKYDEPVTITWGVSSSSVQQFKDGDTYEDNVWSRRIKEDLNIDLVPEWTADGYSEAYLNKLHLCVASGELPDVFRCPDYATFRQAAESGLLADLTDIYDEYAGDYLTKCKMKYPDCMNYATVDGKLYGIPMFNDNSIMATLLWIRDDWLENLNLEAPKTIEDLYEVARAFTYDDPDGDGIDNTYGLGLNNTLLSADHASLMGLVGAWGVPLFTDQMFYRNADGEMTAAVIQDEMKPALAYVQKMYQEGLIDPEFVVKDASSIAEDMASGKIGMAFGQQWGTWWPWNLLYESEGAVVHPYPIPTAEGYDYKLGYNSNASGEIICISASCEHPEAVIQMINHYRSINNPDMSDDTAALYDADEQYRFNPCWSNEPHEANYAPFFRKVQNGEEDISILNGDLLNKYNLSEAFENGESTANDAYGNWGAYSKSGSLNIIQTVYASDDALVQSLMSVQPDSQVQYGSTLMKIVQQAYTNIITTDTDVDSAFDQFVEDWKNAGGQKVLDEMEELYPQ